MILEEKREIRAKIKKLQGEFMHLSALLSLELSCSGEDDKCVQRLRDKIKDNLSAIASLEKKLAEE